MSEINRLMPIFQKTVENLAKRHPGLHISMPTVSNVESAVRKAVHAWPAPVTVTLGDEDKYDAFAASTAALACSGTISVELAMARLPTVIAYKVNALTASIVRHLIKAKYATLINIMQDRMVMPEYLQEYCTPENLTDAVKALLIDPAARQRQESELASIAGWLGHGTFVPSERAAQVVLDVARKAQGPKP